MSAQDTQAVVPSEGRPAVRRSVPRATYRIQFNPSFTFTDARGIVDYLHSLGVSDLYASPLFTARAGSSHGYDVTDYGAISAALGGEEGFLELSRELRERGMSVLLDIVPNHMGIGDGNPWWVDVLENGQSSPYAAFFDIDWQPVKPELAGKVLLPILGDQYGVVLEKGELQLSYEGGSFCLNYYETCLPLAPRTTAQVLTLAEDNLTERLGKEHRDLQEYLSILTALRNLPSRDEQDPELLAERRREKEVIRRRIADLYTASEEARAALDAAIRTLNGTPGKPRSFDRLHDLIDSQPYRLAFWRVAAEEINYRRFFDINDLAAVRVEQPEVFERMHELVMRLAADGHLIGLRIDHPDGLWDPPAYFSQLQQAYRDALRADQAPTTDGRRPQTTGNGPRTTGQAPTTDGQWPTDDTAPDSTVTDGAGEDATADRGLSPVVDGRPLYVVAEKILSEREPLPFDWAVAGTTGYDFLNSVSGLFVDRRAERELDGTYRRFIAPKDPAGVPSFEDLVHDSKQLIIESSLASEIRSLVHRLERVNEKNRRYRDFTLGGLTRALTDVISAMSIYRTYITDPDNVSERDRRYITAAVREARRRHPRTSRTLFSFLEDTLLLRNLREFREEDHGAVLDLVMRFQQITGPIMAKSVEDTTFYIFNRLVSLNEVGGAPEQFGVSPQAFHRDNAERARHWPHAMLTGSTHDTKRSEDVRARIHVLSEIPAEWEAAVGRWAELSARHKSEADDAQAPDRNDEYLLYQTLIGAWPIPELQVEAHKPAESETLAGFRERVVAYMQKATKEAKVHTSWINPNEAYDAALRAFVEALLDDAPDNPFVRDALALARRAAFFGRFNSLAQTLLRLTSPGVPDVYQGTELWDLSLVDPDNRRPVDFGCVARLLAEIHQRVGRGEARATIASDLMEHSADGCIKLYLVTEALDLRRRRERLFAEGDYRPLEARGGKQEHAVAFARALGEEEIVAVAPRLVVGLTDGEERLPVGEVWGDTRLTLTHAELGRRYRDVLTGAEHIVTPEGDLALADVLATLPVALLEHA
ncbi:MAG: hypothetical protein RLZZ387_3092 [Chloroflexota bacterium]